MSQRFDFRVVVERLSFVNDVGRSGSFTASAQHISRRDCKRFMTKACILRQEYNDVYKMNYVYNPNDNQYQTPDQGQHSVRLTRLRKQVQSRICTLEMKV